MHVCYKGVQLYIYIYIYIYIGTYTYITLTTYSTCVSFIHEILALFTEVFKMSSQRPPQSKCILCAQVHQAVLRLSSACPTGQGYLSFQDILRTFCIFLVHIRERLMHEYSFFMEPFFISKRSRDGNMRQGSWTFSE